MHISWHSRRAMDGVNGSIASVYAMAVLAMGLFGMAQGILILLPLFSGMLVFGGIWLMRGLRALWRCLEVVQVRVEGRCLNVRDGPFSWRRERTVNGALVRRLRLIRERVPYLDRVGRLPSFKHDTLYTLMADMRDGSKQVVARGFQNRAEPLWLAFELHRALDLAEPVELQA